MTLTVTNFLLIESPSRNLSNVSFPTLKYGEINPTNDRFQLIGKTVGGRRLKIIFQLKLGNIVRMNIKKKMTENEIDELVENQAEDSSAWKKPVRVRKKKCLDGDEKKYPPT
jgi:hypothetical protein